MTVERDLLHTPDYPSHIVIRDHEPDDDGIIATLWLGNENAGEECDVYLTDEDVAWLIDALQSILLQQHPAEPQMTRSEAVATVLERMKNGW